jgi:hypothetical protein
MTIQKICQMSLSTDGDGGRDRPRFMKKIKVLAIMTMQELDVRSNEGDHKQCNGLNMNGDVTEKTWYLIRRNPQSNFQLLPQP